MYQEDFIGNIVLNTVFTVFILGRGDARLHWAQSSKYLLVKILKVELDFTSEFKASGNIKKKNCKTVFQTSICRFGWDGESICKILVRSN